VIAAISYFSLLNFPFPFTMSRDLRSSRPSDALAGLVDPFAAVAMPSGTGGGVLENKNCLSENYNI
jgi:hypothetical protein